MRRPRLRRTAMGWVDRLFCAEGHTFAYHWKRSDVSVRQRRQYLALDQSRQQRPRCRRRAYTDSRTLEKSLLSIDGRQAGGLDILGLGDEKILHRLIYKLALTRLLKRSSQAARVRRVILPARNGLQSGYVVCYIYDEAGRIMQARCLPVKAWAPTDSVAMAFEKILQEVRRADLQLERSMDGTPALRLVRSI